MTETDIMFNYDDAKAFLRDNAYQYYANNTTAVCRDWRDKLFLALLHSFPTLYLLILSNEIAKDSECPKLLRLKVKGVLKGKVREYCASVTTNELLRSYLDKKSGKVTTSKVELMARFNSECAEEQQLILEAFLQGGKKEMEWAGRHLKYHWVRALEPVLAERWRMTHNPVLAKVVLRYMPDSFIMEEQEHLVRKAGYASVCARLVNVTGFHLCEDRLDTPEYLYVMAKSDAGKSRSIYIASIIDALTDEYLNEVDYIPQETIGIILWSLGKLGLTDTLIRIKPDLEKKAERGINRFNYKPRLICCRKIIPKNIYIRTKWAQTISSLALAFC